MKQTILVVIIALIVTTPCLAQEIDSIEGTVWVVNQKWLSNKRPFVNNRDYTIGFWNREMWSLFDDGSCLYSGEVTYEDFSEMILVTRPSNHFDLRHWSYSYDMIDPLAGVGQSLNSARYPWSYKRYKDSWERAYWYFSYGTMALIDSNWTPPGTFSYIYPRQVEQGTTLTSVKIRGENTTFQDNPPVEINIYSPEGLTVSNINVISNTEIEFDLDIAVDAPIGFRAVGVTYDEGKQYMEDLYFEVLP